MSRLPRLIRGQVGPIGFDDMNAVFRHVERDANEQVDEAIDDQEKRSSTFFGKATDLQDHPTAPFGKVLSWDELALTDKLILKVFENSRSSTEGEDDFTHAAVVLEPLAGLIHVATDSTGKRQYVFQSAQNVHTAKITEVVGGPFNATYSVKSADGVIEIADATPINRWSGLNYQALSIGAVVLLLISTIGAGFGIDDPPTGAASTLESVRIDLVAFERPDIEDCNAKGASGFSDALIGL